MITKPTDVKKLRNELRMMSRASKDQAFKALVRIARADLERLANAGPAHRDPLEAKARKSLDALKVYVSTNSRERNGEGQ